ncbi:MAG: putative lipid II flippase FtsW [Spirochaetales bacterium]|nr:putative lipid II flippase FtsW [Spirochaetales bacterium]
MSGRFVVEPTEKRKSDLLFLGLLLLLAGAGLVAVFSSSYYYAEKLTGDSGYFFKKHLWQLSLGGGCAYIASRLSVEIIRKLTPVLLFFSFLLVCLTFVPGIGTQLQGAKRWFIIFGQSFQPSELVKLSLILYLASIFAKKEDRMGDFFNAVLPPLLVVVAFAGLIYLQNDFSTAVFVLLVAFIMFFVAGIRLIYFILAGSVALPLSIILLLTKEHRVQRIISFLNPQADPIGAGYQVISARTALIRGGIWGTGLGLGTKKMGGLPDAHSDFVFAVLGEETGFIGVIFILTVFIAFAVRGYLIAAGCTDRYSYYLAFGLTTAVITQALFNIAVVSGLVPATGIPLPFFSTGGSSIVVTLSMCGILLNLSRSSSKPLEVGG